MEVLLLFESYLSAALGTESISAVGVVATKFDISSKFPGESPATLLHELTKEFVVSFGAS